MPTTPVLVPQGTLNRLRASISVPSNTVLNITSPFLGKAGIRLGFEGQATVFIDTMTGRVISEEPYLSVQITANLLKTNALGPQYKVQMEQDSAIGNITVRPDSSSLPAYDFINCAIQSVRELDFAGTDASYVVTIGGTYVINQALWNL